MNGGVSDERKSRRRSTGPGWVGLGGTIFVAGFLVLMPFGSANTAKPPFSGQSTPITAQYLTGCGSSLIKVAPYFHFKTGHGAVSVASNVKSCTSASIGNGYEDSATTGVIEVALNLPHLFGKLSTPFTNISLTISVSGNVSSSETIGGPCAHGTSVTFSNVSANPSYDVNYTYNLCEVFAEANLAGYISLVDDTNGTSWLLNGSSLPNPPPPASHGPYWGPDAFNLVNYSFNTTSVIGQEFGPGNFYGYTPGVWTYTTVYNQTPWGLHGSTNYSGGGSIWFNSTSGAMVTASGAGGYTGWTFNPHHSYSVELAVDAGTEAVFTGFPSGRGAAAASYPVGFTITSVGEH
jgi:hypothetical protein